MRSIQQLADSLGFCLLAEFVETPEQRDRLAQLGCTLYQGYLYSPALPLDGLLRISKEWGCGPMRLPESPDLCFRPLTMEDVGNLCDILQDPETMTAYEHAFSMQEVYTWLGRQQARYIRYGFGCGPFLTPVPAFFVGQVGLTISGYSGRFGAGDRISAQAPFLASWLCCPAAAACRDFAFTSLEAPRVVSIIRDTNEASKRVAERIGLRPESTFVKRYYGMDMPHIVYALDRGDFYKKAGEPDGQ